MAMELDLYFRPEDIKALASTPGIKSVVVSAKTVLVEIPPNNKFHVLLGYAKGYDETDKLVGNTVYACPTPCKPGGGTFTCGPAAEQMLTDYENKGYFSDI